MDISNLNPRKAADENLIRVVLVHPSSKDILEDDSGENLVIEVYGKDSSVWRKSALRHNRKKATKNAAELNDLFILILADCTDSISDNILIGDEPPESAKALYKDQEWIAEQVLE
jgi:hypothetical protein